LKTVILAGGTGTRISEETYLKPKPMIEVGGKPLIWHLMKIYSNYRVNDFIICCGYKGYVIKEYFANYFLHNSDVTFDLYKNKIKVHEKYTEPWSVTLLDTGENTQTGGRLKRAANYLKNEKYFCFTYGDGLADINIKKLIKFHENHGKLATVTTVQPLGRFGSLDRVGKKVRGFIEKPKGDGGWINGGFFVLSPKCFDYIKGDMTVWEKEPLSNLAKQGELMAYEHNSFWQPMDTLREKNLLEDLWKKGNAPWKIW
jgi:glucose-1-phosphate cytidylyltransferase